MVFSILNKFRLRTRSFCPPYAVTTARSHGPCIGAVDRLGLPMPPSPAGALVRLLGLHLSPSWSMGPALDWGSSTSCLRLPFLHSAELFSLCTLSAPSDSGLPICTDCNLSLLTLCNLKFSLPPFQCPGACFGFFSVSPSITIVETSPLAL